MGLGETLISLAFLSVLISINLLLTLENKRIRKDILLIAKNPQKAKREILSNPRYKNLS